jgi:hypothetical protein
MAIFNISRSMVGVSLSTDGVKTIQSIKYEILLLHDREDLEVPYQHAENLIAVAKQARLHTTRGLGHKKILRDRSCLQTRLDFIPNPTSY